MFRTATIVTAAIAIAGLMATTAQADNKNKNRPAGPPPTNTKVIKQQTITVNTGGSKKSGGPNYPGTMKQKTTVTTTTTTNFKNTNFNSKNSGKFKQNVGTNPNIKVNTISGTNISPVSGGKTLKFTPGPGPVTKVNFKPAPNVQFVKLGQFSAPVWNSGPKKIWWGNQWKVFVPLTALGVVALAGAYYYPDAYLTTSRYYCEGITPNGCRLNWQRIDFMDGGSDWQCVQYCRRPDMPPPQRTVAFVAPPPPVRGGGCEISIFSEPNFGGTNATANEEQAHLGDNGWQNQIASVRVKSGTWDFFSDQEFTGETMRLPPGDYANLGPEWTKRSGSLMCVQP